MGWFKREEPPETLKMKFSPQADITAYELACILSRVWGTVHIQPETWNALDKRVKIHFEGT